MDERWRGLTVGLVLNVTFVAFEALAVATIMPLVANDLGGIELYGWVFSAFLLANLVGIVVAGEFADRFGPATPFGVGLALFSIGLLIGGLAPSMPVLVAGGGSSRSACGWVCRPITSGIAVPNGRCW